MRNGTNGLEVLMGRRSSRARFMPGYYVFPGGRLERQDRRASGYAEALGGPPPALDGSSRRLLRALARAAVRETYEETGLLVGLPGRPLARPFGLSVWRAFARAGSAPAFDRLRLIARAVTPPSSPIRFDTRFFLGLGCEPAGRLGGDGELGDVDWRPCREALGLPQAEITRLVLRAALAHTQRNGRPRRAGPCFRIPPEQRRRAMRPADAA